MDETRAIELKLGLTTGDVKTGLDAVRQQFAQASGAISQSLANIKGFADIKRQTEETARAYGAAQQKVADLAKAIKSGSGGAELTQQLDTARKSSDQLQAALNSQKTGLQRLQTYVRDTATEYRAAGEALKALRENRKGDTEAIQQAKNNYASLRETLAWVKGEYQTQKAVVTAMAASYREAGTRVSLLKKELADTRKADAALTKDFDQAKQAAASLKQTLSGQQQELQRLRTTLSQAGVSTANLAAGQTTLRQQLEQTRAKYKELAQVTNARDTLGIQSHADIQAAIAKTREAYATLASSGKLSLRELAQAKVAMRQRIDELTAKTIGWKEAVVAAKAELATVAVAGIALVQAGRNAIGFEAAMADVRKTVGGSKEEINALGRDIQGMSTTTIPMLTAELAGIAAAGGQLKIAAKDIGAFTELTAKMAIAFNMTADESGESIGKLKNVFELTIPEVEGLGDAINQLGNNSAAKEKDILNVMLRVGGTAKQFGLAKESTAALAAAMLSLGKPAEVAGTSINALLNRMQTANTQGKSFRDALARIGMSAKDMAAQVAADPQRALDNLLETLSKLSGQDRAEVLTGLFGQEFQDDISVLVGSLGTYQDAMGQVADRTKYAGAMNREFATQSETSKNQLQLLQNTVMSMVNAVGTGFLPAVNAVASGLNAVLAPIAALMQQFPKLSATLATVAAGFVVFKSMKRLIDIARLALSGIGPAAVTGFGQAEAAAGKFSTKLGTVGGSASKLLGIIGKGIPLLEAFGTGFAVGDLLNNFDIVRKGGASLIYSMDRVRLGAIKMWRTLTGGDVGDVDRQIENAKQAYQELLDDIDKKQDDWSKKRRGELPGQQTQEPEQQPSAEIPQEQSREMVQPQQTGQEAVDEQRQDRLQALDEELEAKRTARNEAAFDAGVKAQEQLEDLTAKAKDNAAEWDGYLERIRANSDGTYQARIAMIDAERQAAEAAHQDTLIRIQAEAAERQRAYEQQKKDLKATRDDLKNAHDEKMAMIDQEAAEASQAGDDKAIKAAEKKRAAEEKAYEKEVGKLDTEATKVAHAQARSGLETDRQTKDAARDYQQKVASLDTQAQREADAEQKRLQEQAAAEAQKRQREQTDEEEAAREKTLRDDETLSRRRRDKRSRDQAEQETEENKQDIVRQTARDRMEQLEEESLNRLATLRGQQTSEQLAQIDQVAQAQKEATEQRLAGEQQATEKAGSVFEAYANKVKALSADIERRTKQQQQDLVDQDPTASEETKWKLRAKQAREYEQAAKAAMNAGNLQDALKLSDQAAEAYKGLKQGGQGVDAQMAARTSYLGAKSSGALGIAIEKLMASAMGQQATVDLGPAGAQIAQLSRQVAAGQQGGSSTPVKVIEFRFPGGKLDGYGDEASADALLRQLEQAGLTA